MTTSIKKFSVSLLRLYSACRSVYVYCRYITHHYGAFMVVPPVFGQMLLCAC